MEENKVFIDEGNGEGFKLVEDTTEVTETEDDGSLNALTYVAVGGLILVGIGLKVVYDKVKPLAAKAISKIRHKDEVEESEVEEADFEDPEDVENFEEAKAN